MKKYYRIITIVLSFLLLYFLIAQLQFGDVLRLLQHIRIPYLLAALGVYMIVTALRALRFCDLVGRSIRFRDMLLITFAHAFATSVMPARSGELAYVYYIKKTGNVGLGTNIASLFIARAFDTLVTVVFMLGSIAFIARGLRDMQQVIFLTAAGFIIVVAVFLLFFFWESKVIWMFNLLFDVLRLKRYAFGGRILEKINEVVRVIAAAREPRLFLRTLCSSLAIWTAIYFFVWFIALGLGLPIDFWQSVFVSSLPTLVSTVPFYTVGNFGLFEGSKTLALTLLGFMRELSISFSFLSHIAEIVLFAIPGIVAHVWITLKWSKRNDADTPPTLA